MLFEASDAPNLVFVASDAASDACKWLAYVVFMVMVADASDFAPLLSYAENDASKYRFCSNRAGKWLSASDAASDAASEAASKP